jgi:hypothetical protein
MKTSNYILIAFFVFLFGGVLILFIASKAHKKEEPKWFEEKKPLDSFSVVVAEPGSEFNVRFGENPQIEAVNILPDSIRFPKSIVRHDTLFIFPPIAKLKSKKLKNGAVLKYPNLITIYSGEIRSIVCKKNALIELREIMCDTFNISSEGGKIYAYFPKSGNSLSLLNLHLEGKSYLQLNDFKMKTLKVQMNQSELRIQNSNIDTLSGSMVNNSIFRSFRNIQSIHLETDSTSIYTLKKEIFTKDTINSGEILEVLVQAKSYQ